MPTLTIFSGINGAGKSTLYNTFLKNHPNADFGKRINMDEILIDFNGDKNSIDDNIKAGQLTVKYINECIKNKISFNWETTVFSSSSFKFLERAKENGFEINIHFIAAPNLDLTLDRINNRTKNGGHYVPTNFVVGRFNRQFKNFNILTKLVDSIYFYENIDKIKLTGIYHNGKFAYVNKKCDWLKAIQANNYLSK